MVNEVWFETQTLLNVQFWHTPEITANFLWVCYVPISDPRHSHRLFREYKLLWNDLHSNPTIREKVFMISYLVDRDICIALSLITRYWPAREML